LLLAAARTACGESLYVVEQLVVNVNSAPDASGERIATVKSGERVEVLERVRDQVHVQLGSGRDGWIRAGYLSADEPLRVRLAASTAEVAKLREQVSQLEALGAGRGAATPPALPAAPVNAAPAVSEDSASTQRSLFAASPEDSPRRSWPWAVGAALLGLGVGFALGALTLDRYIRRKYGGLRIY
jgi:hypothetical protein